MVKKTLIILTIVILLVISAVIWGVACIRKSYKLMERGTVQHFEGVVSVPFSYSKSGHIIVPLHFGSDTTTYQFIFDTGASNMLFENFPLVGQSNKVGKSISKGSGGHFMLNEIREISIIRFGGVNFEKQCFEIVSFDWLCWREVYGIIGKETLRHLSWQIDFEKQMIYFSKNIDDLDVSKDAYKIKLRENRFSHHLYLKLTSANESSRPVLFDTGASSGFSFKTKNDVFELSASSTINIYGKQSKGLGGYSKGKEQLIKFDTLYLSNNLFFHDVWARSSESSINTIGLKALKKFRLTFNWDGKVLFLEQAKGSLTFNTKQFGFTTKFEDEYIFVSSVLEKSSAFQQGIRPGQKILSLNGIKINSEEEYCGFSISDLDSVTLIIQDKNTKEFQMKCFKERLN